MKRRERFDGVESREGFVCLVLLQRGRLDTNYDRMRNAMK